MTKIGNILIISAVFPPEPVVSGRLSMDLYQELKKKGYAVKVIHPKATRPYGFLSKSLMIGKSREDEFTTDSYVCPQSSLTGRMRESWSFGKACARYIKDHHNELLCVYANAWPLFAQKAIVKASKKYGIPCVIHVQDVYPESLTNKLSGLVGRLVNTFVLPIDKYILKNCTKIVAISEKMREYLSVTREVDINKISVVVNWQDEQGFLEFQKTTKSQEIHPFTFMYMGNIGPVAGVDLLVDAFVKANLKDARLVIAGSGSMKEKLMEQAAPYRNIEFWDVPNGKVPEIQAKADCMLLPIKKGASSSSIPSKLPAYMFSAKPIIGCMDTDSDTAETIRLADCGWVIEPENAQLLAEKMKTVATLDAKYLNEYGEKALKFGLEHFSKKTNLSRLVHVIEEL